MEYSNVLLNLFNVINDEIFHLTITVFLSTLCPLLRSMCSLIADLELAALDLCSASLFFQLPA